ncbi:MutS domain III [Hathewaya proteolytica DSM 3090]|uniref:MutS domain III n=1 Tax=Hathewaya proteolytica DSM 3090 TaxID=1121331 RepID=A0A1M6PTM0_9CLOT|nr:hypothetical protein [Hathewaya proteolytica]SHK11344.1 MutS domain III [Hathewaya proteolytica DSM 3090]
MNDNMGIFGEEKNMEKIRKSWRKESKIKRNFKSIRSLFDILKGRELLDFYIDDNTFEDLNLEQVFCKIDRNQTTVGQQVLYSMLRTPLMEEDKLKERDKKIRFFQEKYNERMQVQLELSKIGKNKNDVFDMLWDDFKDQSAIRYLFYLLPLMNFMAIIWLIFSGFSINKLLLILTLVVVDIMFHYKTEVTLSTYMESMKYLGYLISGAGKLGKIKVDELKVYTEPLATSAKKCETVRKKAAAMSMKTGNDFIDSFLEYINIITFMKERAFYSVIKELNKLNVKEELKNIYFNIGELDALISIASYREGMEQDKYCVPQLKNNGRYINAKGIYHPMLENPVPNDITMDERGIILTGSNMAGKSTFLRTIGANAVMAQTICTCNAKSYESSYFYTLSSISPEDNLLSGKSYYYGEVEGILRIIKKCNEEMPVLALIDEIFRGTNPVERVSAATEILSYLDKNNALVLVATHDLELTKLLNDKYECYYFREDVKENEFIFDYLIKKGVSPTRNAIRILKHIGYPDEIVDNAEKRIAMGENIIK